MDCKKYGLVENVDVCVRSDDRPILRLDTSPDFEDVIDFESAYENLKENHPEILEEWIHQNGKLINGEWTPREIPINDADEIERFVRDFYDSHPSWLSDEIDMYWESEVDYLQSLLNDAGFEDGDVVHVTASRVDWRGQSGHRSFYYESAEDFVNKTFGAFGQNFSGSVKSIGDGLLTGSVATHDIPTGNHMEFHKIGTPAEMHRLFRKDEGIIYATERWILRFGTEEEKRDLREGESETVHGRINTKVGIFCEIDDYGKPECDKYKDVFS